MMAYDCMTLCFKLFMSVLSILCISPSLHLSAKYLIVTHILKVIVDILLSFLAKPSGLLRAMATRVFSGLLNHISAPALARIVEVCTCL